MINIKEFFTTCIEQELTTMQLITLICLNNSKDIEYFYNYGTSIGLESIYALSDEGYKDLEKRGFIKTLINSEHKEVLVLGEKAKDFLININTCVDDIFDIYPMYFDSNGVNYPLTLMNRNEFAKEYLKQIDYSLDNHKEVLLDLEYAIKHSLITNKIEKFLYSKQYLNFRKLRNGVEKTVITTILSNETFDYD